MSSSVVVGRRRLGARSLARSPERLSRILLEIFARARRSFGRPQQLFSRSSITSLIFQTLVAKKKTERGEDTVHGLEDDAGEAVYYYFSEL